MSLPACSGVYMLATSDTRTGRGIVKIGLATNIAARAPDIARMSAVPLYLHAWLPEEVPHLKALEGALHNAARKDRLHGEWFRNGWAVQHVLKRFPWRNMDPRPAILAYPQLREKQP